MIVRIIKHAEDSEEKYPDRLIECDNVHWGKCKWADESNRLVSHIVYIGDFYDANADESYIDTEVKQITTRYYIHGADVYIMNNEGKTVHKIVFD